MESTADVLLVATRGVQHATAAAGDGGTAESVVTTGQEGLDRLASSPPDFLVVGSQLPDMSVAAFVEQARETAPGTPVIVISEDDPERLKDAGAAAVLERGAASEPWQRYDTIVNTVRDGIYQFDRDGCFVALNDAIEDISGYSRDELLGEHVSTIIDEDDLHKGSQLVQDLVEEDTESVVTMELTVERADGTTVPCESRIAPLFVDDEFVGTVGVVRDISDRKERERQFQQERDLREQLLNTSPIGIGVVGADGEIRRANERAADILGVPETGLQEREYDDPVWSVYDEDGNPIPTETFPPSQVFATGEPVYDWVAQVERPDDERVWVRFNAAPLFAGDDAVERVVLTMEDVTEDRERESELREQAALLEGIFNAVPDVIYTFDDEGNFLRWNDRLAEATGYTDAEIAEMGPLDFVPDEDKPAIEEAIADVIKDRSVSHVESALLTKDGERIPYDYSGGPVIGEDGDVIALTGVGRDVSDHVERERQIDRQRRRLEELNRISAVIRDIDQALLDATTRAEAEQAVCDRLATADAYHCATLGGFDADGHYTTRVSSGVEAATVESLFPAPGSPEAIEAVETAESAVAYDSSASETLRTWRRAGYDVESVAAIPIVYEGTTYGVVHVFADRGSAFDERERTVLEELGETLGHAIASIEREKRERILTTLQASTRELINAETKAEVSERVVDAAGDVLDAGVGIFLFDPEIGRLRVSAATPTFEELYGEWPPDLERRDAAVWTAFLDDETLAFDDRGEPSEFHDAGAESGLVVPLGDHGVFAALSSEERAFGPDIRRVLDLFAATAEATLDRVEGEQELREQDRTLKERNRQLTHLKRINDIIRELDQSVIQASTREEIEQAVCEHLAGYEQFAFVWIGTQDWAGESVAPRTWAGDDHGYLDAVSLSMAESNSLPAVRTLQTGAATHVGDAAKDLRSGSWRKEALKRDYRAAVSVPLIYGEVVYGALTVYATDPAALDEMSRTVLEELGETLGHAINAIKAREDLLTDRAVELELELEDEGVFGRLARQVGCRLSITELVPGAGGTTTVFFTADTPDSERVLSAASDLVAVDDVSLLAEGSEGSRFRAMVSGETVPGALLEWGARPRTIEVDGDRTRIVVGLTSESDVRPLIEKLESRYPGVDLLARRDNPTPELTTESLVSKLDERLTDRQFEVLKTAFMSGFFESPKEQTGREIAASLDITQPTFNHHLRVAQRKLLETVFGNR
ncbi:PAS domain S-box protein [Halorientalis marina]|uniref:PAS domain S-box protein n=1 Tax=Halorientalis marina TaxID=2931976 RepID=UPI001FF3F7C7|nr:PAS domain S-box protein [Halorientalis marina]